CFNPLSANVPAEISFHDFLYRPLAVNHEKLSSWLDPKRKTLANLTEEEYTTLSQQLQYGNCIGDFFTAYHLIEIGALEAMSSQMQGRAMENLVWSWVNAVSGFCCSSLQAYFFLFYAVQRFPVAFTRLTDQLTVQLLYIVME